MGNLGDIFMLEFFHSYIPDSIFLRIGFLSVHWYGVILTVSAFLGLWVTIKIGAEYRVSKKWIVDFFFWGLIGGIAGARLYHVLNELPFYIGRPVEIFKIWRGGLAIHGGLLGGIWGGYFFYRKNPVVISKNHTSPMSERPHIRLNFLRILDIVGPGMMMSQAIGRWGNYFNQELYGSPTTLPWGIPIDLAHRPQAFLSATHFHPAFLYEFLWGIFAFGVLAALHKKKTLRSGTVLFFYLIFFGFGRLLVEIIRINPTPLIWGIRLPILVSALLIFFGLAALVRPCISSYIDK